MDFVPKRVVCGTAVLAGDFGATPCHAPDDLPYRLRRLIATMKPKDQLDRRR